MSSANETQVNISVQNKQAVLPYAKGASLHIKKLMIEHEITYDEVVERLAKRHVMLSSSNLRNKVSGNALSAGLFFLMVDIITGELSASIKVRN